ncbi:SDR family NAD(P)-dependent oxidoreductase [Microbulbifer thermotolerans]|uniref:3-oxoacyl-ACP reductase FabG n=1 Tax=Microbulbifer thermotolerans TaxID=252514 RepID=A0A143HHU3_MICTH|nr:3-oxoacyl-ACP reductase family protein [Microbulbifer thermotolerans]AMX01243.1 oxidoreductase [Microbulbifer thermotolerans]MCX2778431.1 3-oxoacyl-ACP reductase FabG [Microbulbifer thermotolerans]MCX2783902.1 3-oxoacyl-ACP reductase FabG [Microbulbifer thermotolerans]MCX2793915.1 3-oxoacyl-ACP reductase FabG [Microbulbifer thermotolerans]MCX2802507.1 3-oxoacyl-ACP reductase FabG [Microbulbifer thermotolerans]
MNLKDKVAIVSGGARDIGKAVSLKLAAEGAKVVINYRSNSASAEETLREIQQAGGEAIIVQGDMTLQDDVARLVQKAVETYGSTIDILVNVAGGLVARKTLEEMDEAFFNQVIGLNLNSTFLLTKAVVPHMDGGSIINLASQAGRDGGGPGASAYATSKGAVMTFTRAMAKELGPRNIRVNALCPGMISTTFHDTFTKDEVRTNVANATPLKREGRASEVADAVAYLASEEASFITGANLDINGGLLFS